MAGIGYTLKKLLNEDRYSTDIEASLYSLVISSGPWLFSIICISALYLLTGKAYKYDLIIFRVIIVYAYAFSLIFSSFFQLILTRFIADKLYQREYSSLLPNFVGVIVLCGFMSFFISSVYMAFTDLDFPIKILWVILFCVASYQWMIMVFLSAVRDYLKITFIFFIGFLVSFLGALFLGKYLSLMGYMLGFTLGQVLILLFLLERLSTEFHMGQDKIFEFTRYFGKYPPLVWAAFLYNLGYWADKIVLWSSPYSAGIAPGFRYHYPYDTASFLAIITIIPSMAIFFLQVETGFFEELRKYINVILKKGTYEAIEQKRRNLLIILKTKILYIAEFQLGITIIATLLAPKIIHFLGFQAKEGLVPVFIILLFASFFQIFFLFFIVLFWYVELLLESVICVSIFVFLNVSLSYIQIYYTNLYLGTGYLVAVIISFTIAAIILFHSLKDLNYLIFLKNSTLEEQMIPMPKFEQ